MDKATINLDELEAWLSQQPASFSIAIALRAVLRTVPIVEESLTGNPSHQVQSTLLSLFRCLALLAAYCREGENSNSKWSLKAYGEVKKLFDSSKNKFPLVSAATELAKIANFEVESKIIPQSAVAVISEVGLLAPKVVKKRESNLKVEYRREIQRDWQFLIEYDINPFKILNKTLWEFESPPDEIVTSWFKLKEKLSDLAQEWDIWTNWYERILDGDPAEEAFENSVLDLPEEYWDEGPEIVNPALIKLISEYSENESLGQDQEENGSARPELPHQKEAPVQFKEIDGLITPVLENPEESESNDSELSSFHSGLMKRAEGLRATIGANHPGLLNSISEYIDALGPALSEAKIVLLGMAGSDLIAFQEEYAESDPDHADLLPEPKAALKSLVALHQLFIRQFHIWQKFASDPNGEEIGIEKADAIAKSLDKAVEITENNPELFSVETPRILKGISALLNNPGRAVKFGLFWGLRTLENFFLRVATKLFNAIDGFADKVLEHLTKKGSVAVSGAIIVGVGSYLASSFGVLPPEWAWLKPVIEYVVRVLPELAKMLN